MACLERMRIELDDRPGALGAVAAVIGEHGGNITAIDVQQSARGTGAAVDELTVSFADGVDLARLRLEIGRRGTARVISHQAASHVDLPLMITLQLTDALGEPPGERARRLPRRLGDVCGTPATAMLPAAEARDLAVGRSALAAPGEGCVAHSAGLPTLLGETIPGEATLLAIASRHLEPQVVLLLARAAGHAFSATEVDRVEAVVAFHDQLHKACP